MDKDPKDFFAVAKLFTMYKIGKFYFNYTFF